MSHIDRIGSMSSLRPPSPTRGRKMPPPDSEDSTHFFQFAQVNNNRNYIRMPDNDAGSSVSLPESTYSGLDDDVGGDIGSYSDPDIRYKRASRIFLLVSFVSAVLILVLESYMYAVINLHKQEFNSQQRYTEISIFLSLFIFAAVYQIILTIIGLRTKNMLLLMMLCGFYACMLVYTGIQFNELKRFISVSLPPGWRNATKGTNIAVIGVIAITLIVQIFMIFFVLRRNVKWFRYKKIGGDFTIKKLYTVFQIHRSLLIFDFFFFLGFTIQFIVIMIDKKSSVEFILTVCVLPLSIIILIASDYAATRELVQLTVITATFFLLGCVYVLFKTIRLYTKYTSAYSIAVTPGAYFPGRKSLLTFAIITLVLLLTTVAIEVWSMVHYHRGLLPMVNTYYKWLPLHGEPPIDYNTGNISMATIGCESASEKPSHSVTRPAPAQTRSTAADSLLID